MEPTESPLIRITMRATVDGVYQQDGFWFVHFAGHSQAIALAEATDPAPFAVGDSVRITFEKV